LLARQGQSLSQVFHLEFGNHRFNTNFTPHQHPVMDRFVPSSGGSRGGTPSNSRFAPPAETAEDLLKSQTVGLVHLDDFRKRRAEVLEQKERGASGATTPQSGYGFPTSPQYHPPN
jgi:hypothetical protein